MARYAVRRLLVTVLLVVVVSSASLVLARLAPGDYVTDTLGVRSTATLATDARARYGLDQSLIRQYASWLTRVVRFDFGRSFMYDRPVADLLPERAWNSAQLAICALITATLLGVPLGVVSGSRRGGLLARTVRLSSVVLLSAPPLLASLMLVVLATRSGLVPVGGMYSATSMAPTLVDRLQHLVVPVLALALPLAAQLERLQSRAMRDAIGEPFVLAAIARGVSFGRVIWRDAFRVSLRPLVAIYGIVIGSLLSGSFVVETITGWPGLGRLMFDALRSRDVYLVAGCAAAGSIFLAAGMLLSDVALALIDPRIRE
jgi:peptide/nickel transport system permease protein